MPHDNVSDDSGITMRRRHGWNSCVSLSCVGDDAVDIFESFSFGAGNDREDLAAVMDKFEQYCVSGTSEVYETYTFSQRNQEEAESFDALRQLAKNCNFGGYEGRMLRDRLVAGVREDAVGRKLLKEKEENRQRKERQ